MSVAKLAELTSELRVTLLKIADTLDELFHRHVFVVRREMRLSNVTLVLYSNQKERRD